MTTVNASTTLPPGRRCCRCRCSKKSSAICWRCPASACRSSRSAIARRRSSRSWRQAEADVRAVAGIPANYKVLFLQGGASTAVLDGADEPADGGRDRRLHRLGLVGRQGDQGSEEGRHGQRRGVDQGRELLARAGAGGAEADAGRGVRPHDVEQHDRGHRVQGRCPTSATCRSSTTRHRTCSAARSTSRGTR